MQLEDIIDDIERLDYGDQEIGRKFETLRYAFKNKGLPYREVLKSKLYGTIKYLLVELNDGSGVVLITDLDNNRTYKTAIETKTQPIAQTKSKVQAWIEAAKRAA